MQAGNSGTIGLICNTAMRITLVVVAALCFGPFIVLALGAVAVALIAATVWLAKESPETILGLMGVLLALLVVWQPAQLLRRRLQNVAAPEADRLRQQVTA